MFFFSYLSIFPTSFSWMDLLTSSSIEVLMDPAVTGGCTLFLLNLFLFSISCHSTKKSLVSARRSEERLDNFSLRPFTRISSFRRLNTNNFWLHVYVNWLKMWVQQRFEIKIALEHGCILWMFHNFPQLLNTIFCCRQQVKKDFPQNPDPSFLEHWHINLSTCMTYQVESFNLQKYTNNIKR